MSNFLSRVLLFLQVVFIVGNVQANAFDSAQQKIVGGSTVTQGDWPWMVVLSYSTFSASEFFCGASLIDERWVLTAAHCVQESYVVKPADSFAVYVGGSHLYNDPGQLRLIEQVIVHPGYNESTSDNDLALLKLSTPVENAETLPLLPLATMDGLSAGSSTTVIGWGSTIGYDPSNPSPSVNYPADLQQVTMPLVENAICNINLGGSVTSNMICAGLDAGGVDSCQGDSGGPLMTQQAGQWYQVGIVSWGYGCASAGYYGVYTRAANYISWIEDQIFDLGVEDVTFPPVVAGHSMRLPLELSNNTQSVITLQSKSLSSALDLTITNDQCSNLGSGQSCQLEIIYSPTTAGVLSETITINSDSVSYPLVQASITGEAVAESLINPIVGNPDPVLTWGSGGDASWEQSTSTGTEGSTSVVSSQSLLNNQSSWLVGHISLATEKTLFFDWKVSSEKYFDGVELLLDGQVVDAISGEIKWKQNSITIPAGDHVLHWHYRKDVTLTDGNDNAWVDNLSWDTPSPMSVFGEAGSSLIYTPLSGASMATDNGLSAWSTSVNAPWIVATDQSVLGGSSLSSAPIPDGESTVVRTFITSGHQQVVSFDLKVSSEAQADSVSFFINGVKQLEVSGDRDWQHYEYTIGTGSIELLWSYDKDAATSMGSDQIWLDNVKLSEIDHENESSAGSLGLISLFVLILYAYINLSLRNKRYK